MKLFDTSLIDKAITAFYKSPEEFYYAFDELTLTEQSVVATTLKGRVQTRYQKELWTNFTVADYDFVLDEFYDRDCFATDQDREAYYERFTRLNPAEQRDFIAAVEEGFPNQDPLTPEQISAIAHLKLLALQQPAE